MTTHNKLKYILFYSMNGDVVQTNEIEQNSVLTHYFKDYQYCPTA
jgi:hypothetical protein